MPGQQNADDPYEAPERGDALKGAHRHSTPKRKPKPARRSDWWRAVEDTDSVPQRERIMRRGENERRGIVRAQALATLDAVDEDRVAQVWQQAEQAAETGLVTEVSTSLCRVLVDGRILVCSLRGSLTAEATGFTNIVAVGDRVTLTASGGNLGVIESVLPRRSALARPDPFYAHLKQVIVANADQVLVVAAWLDPPLWHELIDRTLIAAERNRLELLLCVNKIDLAGERAAVQRAVRVYRELGYPVLMTSALTGEGVPALREALRGRITALSGLSGVGKSSLLSAVQPGLELRTGAVSPHWSGQGRHTTSQVSLLELEGGGYIVDTPGVRDMGVTGLAPAELERYFPEIARLSGGCRFDDCAHADEPGCAVKAALRQGRLAETRYASYRAIRAQIERGGPIDSNRSHFVRPTPELPPAR